MRKIAIICVALMTASVFMTGCDNAENKKHTQAETEYTTAYLTHDKNEVANAEKQGNNDATGGNNQSDNKDSDSQSDSSAIKSAGKNKVAVKINEKEIFMDEARYYAYTSQATYEVYYLAQNETLDWNKTIRKNVTLEQAVKAEVLDKICRQEALCENAEKYEISFSNEEISQIDKKAKDYFEKSSQKLLDKINISYDSLVQIFKDEEIAKQVEKSMEIEKTGSADEMYADWKVKNKVNTTTEWKSIRYKDRIFTDKDL